MSPQKKAIELILNFIEDKLGYTIETAGLPVGGGLSAEAQAAKDNGLHLTDSGRTEPCRYLFYPRTRYRV